MNTEKPIDKKAGEARFKYELDNVLATIGEDLAKINNGGAESTLKILNLDERIYGRIMNLLKSVEEPVTKVTAKKAEEIEAPAKRLNIQDSVLSKAPKK